MYSIKKIFRLLEKSAVRNSVGVVAVCKYIENIVYNYDPLKIVACLEDMSLLQEESQDDDIVKEKLNIDGTITMYVGNLEKYQGIDLLLSGFQGVAQKKEGIHLVIIGGSKPDIRLYKKKSIQLGIKRRTHFMGPRSVSQLSSFLDQADILVSPRIMGGNTPMKIYSYMDSGKPIIATRLPTHTQVLDEECAVLVDPTEAAMAEGFLSLLENPDFADSIARFAKERARNEFSFDRFKNKLLDFYSQVENQIALVSGKDLKGQFLKT